jgi:NAD(P)-dependent dehydrogenase (short-subunit alcohol dehydrogenase family)
METALAGKSILITGANRGLGQALVEEALQQEAMRVYAGAREPFAAQDPAVTPLILDVTEVHRFSAQLSRSTRSTC